MDSKFWSNDPEDNHRIFRDSKGRMVVKVVTPGGVVAIIGADIPVTTITALKHKIHQRILARREAERLVGVAPLRLRLLPPDDEAGEG